MNAAAQILTSLVKTGAGVFGGVWGYVAVAAVSAAVAGYGTAYTTHKFDLTKYQALELKDAKGVTAALEAQAAALRSVATQQHALDVEVSQGAVAEAKAQEIIVTHTVTLTKEIPLYVHDAPAPAAPVALACIPYGLVRVLDAAALTANLTPVSPANLALPAGQSDDACSPLKATDLAASIASNYAIAGQNAEQLNALITSSKALIDKANTP